MGPYRTVQLPFKEPDGREYTVQVKWSPVQKRIEIISATYMDDMSRKWPLEDAVIDTALQNGLKLLR